MKRGDIVTVAVSGDSGKPRPALIIQADRFQETGTVTVLLISSTPAEAPLIRVPVPPSEGNGLRKPSQIMIDKIMTVWRDKVGAPIGRADEETLIAVSRSLAVFLGIA